MSKVETLINESGLSEDKQLALKKSFVDFEQISLFWKTQAEKIIVNDANDVDMIVLAKEGRKALSEKRIAIEKLRKKLKDASLQEGRMIDTIAKELTGLITPTEEYLKLQETFVQRMEEQRIAKLVEDRKKAFEPYGVDTRFYEFDTMDEAMFETLLLGAKTKFEKEEENKRLLEEARLRKIEEDKKEAEAQRLENIRLKALSEEQRLENIRLKALAEEQAKKIEKLPIIEEQKLEEKLEEDLAREKIKGELQLEQIEEKELVSETPSQFIANNGELTPNTILLGDVIKIDKEYFYYKNEKIEDIHKVYDLFNKWLKQNTK